MVLERAVTVLMAISYAVAFCPEVLPGVTMLGFKRHPSQKMLFSYNAFTTEASTLSVTL